MMQHSVVIVLQDDMRAVICLQRCLSFSFICQVHFHEQRSLLRTCNGTAFVCEGGHRIFGHKRNVEQLYLPINFDSIVELVVLHIFQLLSGCFQIFDPLYWHAIFCHAKVYFFVNFGDNSIDFDLENLLVKLKTTI